MHYIKSEPEAKYVLFKIIQKVLDTFKLCRICLLFFYTTQTEHIEYFFALKAKLKQQLVDHDAKIGHDSDSHGNAKKKKKRKNSSK